MAAASSQSRRSSGPVLRSLSPRGRFQTHNNYSLSSSSPSASAFASSTSSSFYSPPSTFFQNSHQRSESPTRVNLYSASPLSPSFCFSIDQPISPNRSISVSKKNHSHPISAPKRGCMCSPTTHRGSFRCSLHKNTPSSTSTAPFTPNRLNMRRSAMTNSLVRIGGVEGEWVKRALTALIRPSSHQQRRRGAFQSRTSRLSITSNADDEIYAFMVVIAALCLPSTTVPLLVARFVCRYRSSVRRVWCEEPSRFGWDLESKFCEPIGDLKVKFAFA
ncbi:hypothetical protein DKX38_027779 [Salix brachista]|uniref:Serine-rich protein-like protein n=1 Tax=Salix brachista TaxID=2182728 RepID=A0A5N5J953_9ROSI|nr:hypothetical protein DKX38_027779 [Salix brachista]